MACAETIEKTNDARRNTLCSMRRTQWVCFTNPSNLCQSMHQCQPQYEFSTQRARNGRRGIEPVGRESLGRDGNAIRSSRSNVLGLIRQQVVTPVRVIRLQFEPALETA